MAKTIQRTPIVDETFRHVYKNTDDDDDLLIKRIKPVLSVKTTMKEEKKTGIIFVNTILVLYGYIYIYILGAVTFSLSINAQFSSTRTTLTRLGKKTTTNARGCTQKRRRHGRKTISLSLSMYNLNKTKRKRNGKRNFSLLLVVVLFCVLLAEKGKKRTNEAEPRKKTGNETNAVVRRELYVQYETHMAWSTVHR